MLEARLEQASVLKKLLDAVKELVTDANFECTDAGISLQAMDNSHVALVNVMLREDAFQNYRCDRNMPLGINLASLTKVLKCAKDNDLVTLKASDDADSLGLMFEAPNSDRIGEYEIKLMDLDQEHLGIPDTSYDAQVTMSSSEFQKICRDLTTLGESVRIEVTKEGVRFASEGEIGSASIFLNAGGNSSKGGKKVKSESASPKKKVKKEKVKKEKNDDDEEVEGEDEDEEEVEEVEDDEEEEEEQPKKKRKVSETTAGKGKKAKKDSEEAEIAVSIVLQQSVTLTFSLKYLLNFAKSAPLAKSVSLNLSNDVPLLVSFDFESGYINYYLAPKIGDE